MPTAFFLGLRSTFKPDEGRERSETYEVRVGERAFEVRIADTRCTTSEGCAHNPDTVMSLDVQTLYELLFGVLSAIDRTRLERTSDDDSSVRDGSSANAGPKAQIALLRRWMETLWKNEGATVRKPFERFKP